MSVVCLILAYWHNKLIGSVTQTEDDVEVTGRSAPPDTMAKLVTQEYCEVLFGDEDDKRYPSECAICLGPWEPDDIIKVTPCEHAFHEECLGNWLEQARTCALCRKDLVAAPPPERSLSLTGDILRLGPDLWRFTDRPPVGRGAGSSGSGAAVRE